MVNSQVILLSSQSRSENYKAFGQVLLTQKHLGCIGFVTHTYGYNV
jgi:hypothetical protein